MELRKRHWIVALGIAAATHLGLATWAQRSVLPVQSIGGAQPALELTLTTVLQPAAAPAGQSSQPAVRDSAAPSQSGDSSSVQDLTKPPSQDHATEPPAPDAIPVEAPPEVDPAPAVHPARSQPQRQAIRRPNPEPEPQPASEPVQEPRPAKSASAAPASSTPPTLGMAGATPDGAAPRAADRSDVAGDREPDQAAAGTGESRQAYFAELQAYLERHRRYPRAARLRRQQGTAVLYFVIDRQGNVLDYRIERSSGHRLLDREVAAMLERAKPLPPAPPELQRSRFELLLPIRFAMR